MIPPHEFSVIVCLPGYGRFSGGTYDFGRTFKDSEAHRQKIAKQREEILKLTNTKTQ